MTIIEGQIGALKELKESLARNGVTRFSSVGAIRRFQKKFESEKRNLPGRIEKEVEAEVQDLQSAIVNQQRIYGDLIAKTRLEIEQQIHNLNAECRRLSDKRKINPFFRILYFFRFASLSRKAARLQENTEGIINKKTKSARKALARKEKDLGTFLKNKRKLVSTRCEKSLEELIHTKEVVDGHYTWVAGAIGEASVVNELRQLSDSYYLINDFSMKFNPPVYNRKENDRIYSIQIDHLLVCQSGVFVLETKNWSKASVSSLDLRSPVKQILRASFALFVFLNDKSRIRELGISSHHWGTKKVPIRNIIVMTNEKPGAEFQHVKVLSLNELIGYVQYFDRLFDDEEVSGIFEYLKRKMT